jgi:outer membrane protein, heavy metal efflux system
MKTIITIANIFLLGIAVSAQAGYKDMHEAYESYRPSAYFESQLLPAEDRTSPKTQDLFHEDVKKLNATRSNWEKQLEEIKTNGRFSGIDPDLMLSLAAAESDISAAVDALGGAFSKDILEGLVLLRNPAITSAEKKFRAAIEKISQIANLDQILRQYSAFTEGVMTGVGPMKGKDPVSMKFPFPGVMALKNQVVQKEIEVARLDMEKAVRDAIASINKAYWNLQYLGKARVTTQEILTLLGHLEEVATTRYEAGKTSYQDVIKVRINKETLKEKLTTLEERERNVEIKILALLNLPGETRLGRIKPTVVTDSFVELSILYVLAHDNRQEIRQVRTKIEKMERMLEMAETMILPPYTFNLSFYQDSAVTIVGTFNKMETFPTSTTASRGVGLPKNPWYGSNDAYLRQTRQKIEALKASLKSLEDKTTTLVRNTWFELDRSKREESLYKNTVIDLSQASLDVSTRGYESGKVMFADVFESYNVWFKANLTLERKRSDIGIYWAELERVVGKKLLPTPNA